MSPSDTVMTECNYRYFNRIFFSLLMMPNIIATKSRISNFSIDTESVID